MATFTRAAVLTLWRASGGGFGAQLPDLVTMRAGDSVTVIVPDVKTGAAGVTLVEFQGRAATLAEINALTGVIVLANEVLDDETGERQSGNYDSAPTGAQLTALSNQLTARFPALDAARLQDGGRAVIRAGLTRRDILTTLARRLQDRVDEDDRTKE